MSIEAAPQTVESSLNIIAKTGRIEIGFQNVIWVINHRPKQVKMVLIAKNIPGKLFERILQVSNNKKIKIYKVNKTNLELGEAVGRQHSVSTLAILDFGAVSLEE